MKTQTRVLVCTQLLALRVFKAPDNVSYRVLSTETDATRFSAE